MIEAISPSGASWSVKNEAGNILKTPKGTINTLTGAKYLHVKQQLHSQISLLKF